ncbi:MAG: hypothetical protein JWM31_1301 [Solirubrobacterales bacterium]|nr:hypothetical protein [Solirubrobacterales bacterium]
MSGLLPLAAGSSIQTVFVAVTLALGYAVIFALWWFVFREKK